jgi:hypothetical protein
MKLIHKLALLLLLSGASLLAQNTTVTPDCQFFFTFTANGNLPTNGYPNYPASGINGGGVCTDWVVSYTAFNVVGSPSLLFQSAPSATATTPGTWVTYIGTTLSGINPNTSTTGAQSAFANETVATPFVRMNLTGLTSGTISGVVYGYKTGSSGGTTPSTGSGCPGTTGTPCVVVGPVAAGSPPTDAPVLMAGQDGTNTQTIATDTSGDVKVVGPSADGAALAGPPVRIGASDGTDTRNVLSCVHTVIINDSSSGNTQVIALSGSTQVHICKMTLVTASQVNIQLTQGTGTNCATSNTNLSLLYQLVSTVAEDYAADLSYLVGVAGDAVCLDLGSAVQVTGQIWYDQF